MGLTLGVTIWCDTLYCLEKVTLDAPAELGLTGLHFNLPRKGCEGWDSRGRPVVYSCPTHAKALPPNPHPYSER